MTLYWLLLFVGLWFVHKAVNRTDGWRSVRLLWLAIGLSMVSFALFVGALRLAPHLVTELESIVSYGSDHKKRQNAPVFDHFPTPGRE